MEPLCAALRSIVVAAPGKALALLLSVVIQPEHKLANTVLRLFKARGGFMYIHKSVFCFFVQVFFFVSLWELRKKIVSLENKNKNKNEYVINK